MNLINCFFLLILNMEQNMEEQKISYKIAIPSYQRSETLKNKTLAMLQRHKIDKGRIHVFVASQEEYEEYKNVLPSDMYRKIIIGIKGTVQIRNFMLDYFDENDHIFYLDDDILEIYALADADKNKSNRKSEIIDNLDSFIQEGFRVCIEHKCTLVGMYPLHNPFYMKDGFTTDLSFVIGCCFGMIHTRQNKLHNRVSVIEKEDFQRSIQSYLLDSKIVRFNNVAPKTHYRKGKGGTQSERSRETNNIVANLIRNNYPQLVKIFKRKSNGMLELRLKDNRTDKQFGRNLIQTIPELDIKNIAENKQGNYDSISSLLSQIQTQLEKTPLSYSTSRKNSGPGYTQAFGTVFKRLKGVGPAKNNRTYPELWSLLEQLGHYVSQYIKWDGIQVNFNYQSLPHKDKNNKEESWIVSFGDYEGGELCLDISSLDGDEKKYDNTASTYRIENNVVLSVDSDSEGKVPSKYFVMETRKGLLFNGSNVLHWNKPIIKGNKYSLIFYQLSQKSPPTNNGNHWIWSFFKLEKIDEDTFHSVCVVCGKKHKYIPRHGCSAQRRHWMALHVSIFDPEQDDVKSIDSVAEKNALVLSTESVAKKKGHWIWNYFKLEKMNDGTCISVCSVCEKKHTYISKHGCSTQRRHWLTFHLDVFDPDKGDNAVEEYQEQKPSSIPTIQNKQSKPNIHWIWNYFTKGDNSIVSCTVCKKEYKYNSRSEEEIF